MNTSSISSLNGQSAINHNMRGFCVTPEALSKSRTDDIRVVVPKRDNYYPLLGIDQCWDDIWGEACSWQDRFRPMGNQNNSLERSCTKAQKEDPETFESMRSLMENGYNWTLSEMRKSMRWIFNCTGKIPVKECN